MRPMRTKEQLDQIHKRIPPDYYERGITKNIFQRYWHTKRFKAIKKMIGNYKGKSLDIGCHSGRITKLIADTTGTETYGLDISPEAIKYAREKYPNLHFRLADVQNGIPYASSTFDLITCFDVLEHILDIKKLIQEIRRVLKREGALIIGVPVENILWRVVWFFWTKFKGRIWQEAHINKFGQKELKNLFENKGFTKIKERKIHLGMWRIVKYQYHG